MTTFYVAICGECEAFCSFHSPAEDRQHAEVNAGHHDRHKHQSATTTHETALVESFESDGEYPRRPDLSEFLEDTADEEEPEEVTAS